MSEERAESFACLGGAFIFVEIALMQRFALLLGHPSRSLALVLATSLFSAGVGGYASGRWSPSLPVGLVAPLGVLMGMPFPTGIRIVATHGEDSVPWM